MNNLSKITLSDDVMASRLYDGIQNEEQVQTQCEELVPQDNPEENSQDNPQKSKKRKFKFNLKKPIFKVKNLGLKKPKFTKGALRKNGLVACCVLLIAVAVWLNFSFSKQDTDQAANTEQMSAGGKILGESALVSGESELEEDYFSVAVINRQRVRDEAIDMLREVMDSQETNSAIRENAFNEMTRMAGETNSEINIENLITAKGFEECVAVINGNTANVIVKSQSLTPEQIAQIQEIVYTQSGTAIENIKIIEKQ